jgi:hypothetical protein
MKHGEVMRPTGNILFAWNQVSECSDFCRRRIAKQSSAQASGSRKYKSSFLILLEGHRLWCMTHILREVATILSNLHGNTCFHNKSRTSECFTMKGRDILRRLDCAYAAFCRDGDVCVNTFSFHHQWQTEVASFTSAQLQCRVCSSVTTSQHGDPLQRLHSVKWNGWSGRFDGIWDGLYRMRQK